LMVVTIGLLKRHIETGPPDAEDGEVDAEHRTFAPLSGGY